eukprot:gi/632964834/ref/XP_007898590.1/ PREDICTED: uncharacterized protein LOC103183124 [Callorhinchus milii]
MKSLYVRTIYTNRGRADLPQEMSDPSRPSEVAKRYRLLKSGQIRCDMLVQSANQFIKVAQQILGAVRSEMLTNNQKTQYEKEILHTILFFCHINIPRLEPEDIFGKATETLNSKYADILTDYKMHLPTRPPYTILLDIVVTYKGANNVPDVLEYLWSENKKMQLPGPPKKCENVFCFVSRVINYCYFEPENPNYKSDKYYGASVSCTGHNAKKIMIDILCLKTWNSYICQVVGNAPEWKLKCPFVYSNAYIIQPDLKNSKDFEVPKYKPPCKKCLELYPDLNCLLYETNNHEANWLYGNCAENESLSKLLNDCENIVIDVPENFDQNIVTTKRAIEQRLRENLRDVEFQLGNTISFYNSQ